MSDKTGSDHMTSDLCHLLPVFGCANKGEVQHRQQPRWNSSLDDGQQAICGHRVDDNDDNTTCTTSVKPSFYCDHRVAPRACALIGSKSRHSKLSSVYGLWLIRSAHHTIEYLRRLSAHHHLPARNISLGARHPV